MRRVVVTGIGIICPIGIGSGAFWENLLAGRVGIGRIGAFDPSGLPWQIGGEVPPFKIGDYVPKSYRKATKVMARDIELAVAAADDAFKDCGLKSRAYTDTPTIDPARFGCNIGAGLLATDLNELSFAMHTARNGNRLDLKAWGREGMNQLTPLWLLKYLPNMLACHVTIIHELKGPSNTITCADASSHLAIGEAFRTIQRGKADVAICGGAECKMAPMSLVRQGLVGRLSDSDNDRPTDAVRPFDETAAGTAVGEGGGLFILEELEHAKARGAKMYAELVGFGASQDAYSVTQPDPSGHSHARAILSALADAKAEAGQIDLLVPHGLGIPSHDRAELAGLSTALGSHLEKVAIAPIKGQTSALAAGCGVDAAAAALGVFHDKIPPALHTRTIIDGRKLNVSAQARSSQVRLAASSVYSLGGQNAALVFKKI